MTMKFNWQSKLVNVRFLARNNDATLVMRCCWRRDKNLIGHAMLLIFDFGNLPRFQLISGAADLISALFGYRSMFPV
jgi:hypothetical protein